MTTIEIPFSSDILRQNEHIGFKERARRIADAISGKLQAGGPFYGFGGPRETPTFSNTIPTQVEDSSPVESTTLTQETGMSLELIAAQIRMSPTGDPADLSVHGLHRALSEAGGI